MKLTVFQPRGFPALVLLIGLCLHAEARGADESGGVETNVDYESMIDSLEQIVNSELERGLISGVSIAVIDGQKLVVADGYGLADEAKERPATATTLYRVGSISKLFTALAAMQLVEQSRFDIDAPITDFLKDFRIENPFDDADAVTARQLMCHRAGMVRESPRGGYLDDSEPTIGETVASLESCALVNPPNTKTRYSNLGPTIVGHAVAAISGQSFEQYQRQHLLDPLNMYDSTWRMTDARRERLATGYMRVADGQGGFSRRPAPLFELGTVPAGNLYSTAADMAEFAKMLLAAGQTGNGQLIQSETLAEMGKPQLIDDTTGFGLGFAVGTFAGHRSIHHMGAVYGFTSSLVVLPESQIAAIVLVNEDITIGPVRRLSEAALSLTLQAKIGQQPAATPTPIALEPARLTAMVGDYESASYWAEIRIVEGRAELNLSSQPLTLTPIGPSRFEADGRFTERAELELQEDADGNIDGFTIFGQAFHRVPGGHDGRIPDGWHKFLGSYGAAFIPLVVSARHGHLYAMTENMVDYRLTPRNQVAFRMPEGLYADEDLVFMVAADGSVPSVNLANMTLLRIGR